jgi:hypothetical protein
MSKSAFGFPLIGSKKPKPKGRISMIAHRFAMSPEVELMVALRKWIEDKHPDLRDVASGEDFEAFKKEFFTSQGVQSFDVLSDFLKKARLKYIEQHRPPAKTRIRPIGGQTAPETLKASQMAQEYRASGERVNWRRVAKKVLPDPGKPSTKRKRDGEIIEMTWAQRVQGLEDSVNSYMRRQRKSKKVVG